MDSKVGGGNGEGVANRSRRRWRWVVASAAACISLFTLPAIGPAQTTNITSSGLGTALNGSTSVPCVGGTCDITGGARRGTNLFHSFGFFNVGTGDTANFLNDTGLATSNIVGRVNGGQTSSIYGTIKTTDFGNANLFLINPFGWIFGNGASLDVGGSFHVSTADYLKFADGTFFAGNGELSASGLTANPVAFGFLGPPLCTSPCISVVDGSILKVREGQTLSLVGGDVQITGGATLSAPSGRIQIGSFLSEGEATVDGLNGDFATLGRVEISGGSSISAADVDGDPAIVNGGSVLLRGGQVGILGASIDASGLQTFDADGNLLGGTAGGTVVIRGGQLFVEGSSISAQTFGDEPGTQVGIDVQMDESITLASGSFLLAATSGEGRGGDIQLAADQVTIDGSGVATASFGGEGVGGDVTVEGDTITLTNGGSIQSVVESVIGVGSGGNITMSANESISMSGGSGLFSVTTNAGTGGGIFVSAPSLTMDGAGTSVASLASFGEGPGGAGGAIKIDVGSLSLTDGAVVNSLVSTTSPGVPGQGGSVTVVVAGDANIAGGGSGIVSNASQASPDDITAPGNILVETGTLRLTDGALIQGGTFGETGQGGEVTVRASDSILIADGAGISSQAFNSEVGNVEVAAESLTIDRGFINTGTLGVGSAGDILIDVGTLTLTRGGQIASSSGANAAGAGGDITIRATGSVTISGSSPDPVLPEPFAGFVQDTSSGIFSTTATVGSGGSINLQAGNLFLANSGTISAESFGTIDSVAGIPGNAGNVKITVGDTLRMDGGTITTAAAEAAGGDITITHTGSLLHLTNSQITTSVNGGLGGGGNIAIGAELDSSGNLVNINPFDFIVLNNSGIHANAFGGPGGNINIFADLFLSSLPITTAVTASSALSTPGTIDIQATIVDVSGDVSQLPEAPLQATELLRASCAARLAGGKASSLVLAGRGGIPLEPGGLLPSPLYLGADSAVTSWSHRLPREKPASSYSQFSLFGASNEPVRLGTGWDQFELAKAALGFGCS